MADNCLQRDANGGKRVPKGRDLSIEPVYDIDRELRIVHSFGWAESGVPAHERCDRIWFRHFAGEPECTHNEGKRIQMRLRMWDHRKYGHESVGFDVNITACPPGDNGWCDFTMYGLKADQIESNIDRLLKAWRAVQK